MPPEPNLGAERSSPLDTVGVGPHFRRHQAEQLGPLLNRRLIPHLWRMLKQIFVEEEGRVFVENWFSALSVRSSSSIASRIIRRRF